MKKGVDFTGVSVVFFCHDGKGNILMAKRTKKTRDENDRWGAGGGAIRFREKAEEALVREIREEYDTDVLDFEFLGYRDVNKIDAKKRKIHWVALDFKVKVDKSKVKNNAPYAHSEIGWFTLDNLPDPLHSQMPIFLKKYKKKLVAK